MALDPSIILQSQGVKLDDPLTVQAKRAQLSDLMTQNQSRQMQLQQAQQEQSQQQTLADLYRGSLGDNGQLDRNKLYTGAAQAGLGNRIPGLQKNFADADKTQADVGHIKAQTGKTDIETLKAKLDISSGAISSLLADRNVNNDKVIATLTNLVQQGIMPQDQGAQIARELPAPGDVAGLRDFLIKHGLSAMDASKRLEMAIPKTEVRNMGGTDQQFQTNQLTGEITPGPTFAKTATPGEVMTDTRTKSEGIANRGVQMRGQDIGKVPAGYRTNPDGSMSFIPGGPADPNAVGGKPLTEDQGKATGWLVQATNAWNNMQQAMAKTPGAETPGVGDAVGKVPLLGAAGRSLMGPERQKFNQAASSLSEALLRAATGAGVNKEEAAQKIAEITPQFGDDAQARQQKLAAIPLYLESLKVRAGPGGAKAAGIVSPVAAPAAPKAGAVEDGYVFLGGNPSDPSRWKKQ